MGAAGELARRKIPYRALRANAIASQESCSRRHAPVEEFLVNRFTRVHLSDQELRESLAKHVEEERSNLRALRAAVSEAQSRGLTVPEDILEDLEERWSGLFPVPSGEQASPEAAQPHAPGPVSADEGAESPEEVP